MKLQLDNLKIVQFLGTCSDKKIANMAEKPGRKFSYKRACRMIKEFNSEMHYDLALDFYNPWGSNTNLKKGNILHVEHSAIDYLFLVE